MFLNITGSFDHVRWSPVLSKLITLGASLRTLRMIKSYLSCRTVSLTLEGTQYQRQIERGCPQWSQLGPTLWKVAMTGIGDTQFGNQTKTIWYADDIALLVGAARPETTFKKIEKHLDQPTT